MSYFSRHILLILGSQFKQWENWVVDDILIEMSYDVEMFKLTYCSGICCKIAINLIINSFAYSLIKLLITLIQNVIKNNYVQKKVTLKKSYDWKSNHKGLIRLYFPFTLCPGQNWWWQIDRFTKILSVNSLYYSNHCNIFVTNSMHRTE